VCNKIDAIDGKKWVKFVAMRQNSATLIYDLNTMKGTVESCLKKEHSHSEQCSSKPKKSHLVLKVSKKKNKNKNKNKKNRNCFEPP